MRDTVVELNNARILLEQAEELVDRWGRVFTTDWIRCATVTRVTNMLRNRATEDQIRVALQDVNGQHDDYAENW